jgi:hypothetical protein
MATQQRWRRSVLWGAVAWFLLASLTLLQLWPDLPKLHLATITAIVRLALGGVSMVRPILCLVAACGVAACSEVVNTGVCPVDPYRVEPYEPLSREVALDEWAGAVREDGTRERCAEVYEGSCDGGKHFLLWESSSASDAIYFNDSGDVAGGVHQAAWVIDGCSGRFFGDIHCIAAVGAPLCGDTTGEVELPFND